MDVNICKKCDNGCYFGDIIKKDGSDIIIRSTVRMGSCESWVCYFEFPDKNHPYYKIIKKISDSAFPFEFFDEGSIDKKSLLRNLTMMENDICPYYAEHLLSDINHIERVKKWKNKQKKIIKIKKLIEKK